VTCTDRRVVARYSSHRAVTKTREFYTSPPTQFQYENALLRSASRPWTTSDVASSAGILPSGSCWGWGERESKKSERVCVRAHAGGHTPSLPPLLPHLHARVCARPQQFGDFRGVILGGRHQQEEVARGKAD